MPATRQAWRLWQQIDTAPCDDTWAKVRWKGGRETTERLDHFTSPAWWAEQGATWWRRLRPEERVRVKASPPT